MTARMSGRRVLVTGGGTGIGEATVLELARQAAIVGIHYFRSEASAGALKERLVGEGVRAEIFQADLTEAAPAEKLVEEFVAWAGGMDCLINNAGEMVGRKSLDDMPVEFLRQVMAVNLDSTMMVTKASLPHLRKAARNGGASIVTMSSLAGRLASGINAAAYCAAKGAIVTWTRSMAHELADDGIRINAVAPGLILDTNFHKRHTPEESQRKAIEAIPLHQAGKPADVARAIVFLAGEYDGFMTGAIVDINGGVY